MKREEEKKQERTEKKKKEKKKEKNNNGNLGNRDRVTFACRRFFIFFFKRVVEGKAPLSNVMKSRATLVNPLCIRHVTPELMRQRVSVKTKNGQKANGRAEKRE